MHYYERELTRAPVQLSRTIVNAVHVKILSYLTVAFNVERIGKFLWHSTKHGLDWTGQLDWTVGLDSWTGQLDWTVGLDSLDYWTELRMGFFSIN